MVSAKLLGDNANNNIIYTKTKKMLIMNGISDYIIVEDNKVLMIVPREKEQEIKQIRQRAIDKFGNDLQ